MSNQPLLIKSHITLYLIQKTSVNFPIYFTVSSYLKNMLSFRIVLKYSENISISKSFSWLENDQNVFQIHLCAFFLREPMILLAVS